MTVSKGKKLLQTIFFMLLLLYGLFLNVRLIIQNYNLDKRTDTLKSDIQKMTNRNEKIRLILSYYQTEAYQEVEARRRLQVKRPDEKVLAVKGLNLTPKELNLLEDVVYQEAAPPVAEQQTNFQRWWEYLFG